MSKYTKVFNLKLPTDLYEEFYRLFPERGARTEILRRIVATLVYTKRRDKDIGRDIIKHLRGED